MVGEVSANSISRLREPFQHQTRRTTPLALLHDATPRCHRGASCARMASSCMAQRHALLECLADSPCIAEGKSIKECMELEGAASGCKEFRTAFYLCKRGQVRAWIILSPPSCTHPRSHATLLSSLTCASASRGICQRMPWPTRMSQRPLASLGALECLDT